MGSPLWKRLGFLRGNPTESGDDLEEAPLKPVGFLYYRNYLSKKASGAMSRELLNLASALDASIKPSGTKSLSSLVASPWRASGERQSVTVAQGCPDSNWAHLHVQHTQKETYQDSRTKYLATLPRKGDRNEKGEKGKGPGVKGDWKGDCDSNPKPPIIQTH